MLSDLSSRRVSYMCIGNPLLIKDSFGVEMGHALQKHHVEHWQVLICETVPENFLGKVIKFNPQIVIFVDTFLDETRKSDEILFTEMTNLWDKSYGTHKTSLRQLSDFVTSQCNAASYFLGLNGSSTQNDWNHYVKKNIDQILSYIFSG